MGSQQPIHYLLTIITLASTVAADPAYAEEEKRTDWGNTTGLQSPHPDSKGRSGHWWWPDRSESSAIDGNRGRIFGAWTSKGKSAAMEIPPPPPPPPNLLVHVNSGIMLNNLLFKSNSIEMLPEGKAETDKPVAEMRNPNGLTVTCVGHTDDVGSEAFNQQLGLRRAQTVVDYMIAAGTDPSRVHAESKGESQPAVPNDSPANRALNRRVVFRVTLD